MKRHLLQPAYQTTSSRCGVLAGAICATIVLGSAPAHADEIELEYLGVAGGGVAIDVRYGASSITQQVGRKDWAITSGGSWGGTDLNTFAIDLGGSTAEGTYQQSGFGEDTLGLTGSEVAVVAELFERHFADAIEFQVPGGTDADLVEAGAFQVVLWEIAHEDHADDAFAVAGSLDLSGGRLSFDQAHSGENLELFADTFAMAASWVAELAALTAFDSDYAQQLMGLRSTGRAAFGMQISAIPPIMVPAPTPIALAALGFIAVMIGRRKFG